VTGATGIEAKLGVFRAAGHCRVPVQRLPPALRDLDLAGAPRPTATLL